MARRIWFDRQFELGLPAEAFPDVVERVRGTSARIEELVLSLPRSAATRRLGEGWTIQENVGHLLDLETLWAGRLEDLLAGEQELRPADLENRKTDEAGHNDRPLGAILADFRAARLAIVTRLDALTSTDLQRTARHPRLGQPMTITDLFFFVAEHDDHHLARISEIARRARDEPRASRGAEEPDYASMLEVAIAEARQGLAEGGIPIGAALFTRSGRLLGRGHNRRVQEGDPSIHGETDAFRKAGRQTDYGETIMVTTLAPCWYCSGLIRQFGIGTVVVGESVNFAGGAQWLRRHGVEVIDLASTECAEMLAGYIASNPQVWNEDIGGPVE